jgi:hypothetical protein
MLQHSKRRKRDVVPSFVRRATAVLYDKMIFYDQKAKSLLVKMHDSLKEDKSDASKKRTELAIYCYKEMRKCDDLAIECATKLAPYQTPKLVSVESKTKTEHKFVIRAPRVPSDKDDWMKNTGATILEKEIDTVIAKVVRERVQQGETETTLQINQEIEDITSGRAERGASDTEEYNEDDYEVDNRSLN